MNSEVMIKEYGEEFLPLYNATAPYTMTSPERMAALYMAVNYVVRHNIPGDFVECGVWRGGSSMLAAHTFLLRGDKRRRLFLFDTFSGMTRPDERDVDRDGQPAFSHWLQNQRGPGENAWCYASLDDVKHNMYATGYPADRIHLVPGDVKETLPHPAIGVISILRLDTDWYESTRHELECLYDKVAPNGVTIIDDYGHWKGARRAVDEFFDGLRGPVFLNRIDTTGRLVIKTSQP
jgi:hypothetical protein